MGYTIAVIAFLTALAGGYCAATLIRDGQGAMDFTTAITLLWMIIGTIGITLLGIMIALETFNVGAG